MTPESPASEDALLAARAQYLEDQIELVRLRKEAEEANERHREAARKLDASGPAFRRIAEQYADALLSERTPR